MPKSRYALLSLATLIFAGGISAMAEAQTAPPAVTTYGEPNALAPRELGAFSFLIGKWEATGKVKLEDGGSAEVAASWIGRYILDGIAIADRRQVNSVSGAVSVDGQTVVVILRGASCDEW